MNTPDTPKTLLRILGGPQAAEAHWARFVALYRPLILAWLRLRGLRGDAVEECAQEVCLKLVKGLRGRRYDARRARFRTWLGVIVATTACDRLRAERALAAHRAELPQEALEALPDPMALAPDGRLDAQFRMAALEAAVETLRADPALIPFHRRVLEACVVGETSPTELARALGVSPNRVVQARRRLSSRLAALARQWECRIG